MGRYGWYQLPKADRRKFPNLWHEGYDGMLLYEHTTGEDVAEIRLYSKQVFTPDIKTEVRLRYIDTLYYRGFDIPLPPKVIPDMIKFLQDRLKMLEGEGQLD